MVGNKAAGKQTVIFTHIPRTGGSTLNSILKFQCPPDRFFEIKTATNSFYIDRFKKLDIERKKRLKIISGHTPFGLHRFLPQPSTYITLLRNPIDRILSHYYYVLEQPRHYLYDRVKSQNMTLKDYISSGVSKELDNDQVRILCGDENVYFGFKKCSDIHLKMAKENLRNYFAIIGLQEKFDETIILLRKTFGYKTPFYIKKHIGRQYLSRESISRDVIDAIEEKNRLDMELYRYARIMFEASLCDPKIHLERNLKILRLLNRIIYPIDHAYRAIRKLVKLRLKVHYNQE